MEQTDEEGKRLAFAKEVLLKVAKVRDRRR